jgi:hypothetical protein
MPVQNPNEIDQMTWYGWHRAKITNDKDPKKLGRVRVWVPDTMIEVYTRPENQTPEQAKKGETYTEEKGLWALPANNIGGGRNDEKDLGDNHYYQGSCLIPTKGSWVWIFFENGNPSEPRYGPSCNLENEPVPAENRLGTDYQKKWTLYKTRMGRCIIMSDDGYDERIEITGKKRILTGGPSDNEESVYPIIGNQTTILLDERVGQEKILIEDYKGNFLKFDIEKEQMYVNFHDNITIHSDKTINLDAGKDINFVAKENMKILVGINSETNVGTMYKVNSDGTMIHSSKSDMQVKCDQNILNECLAVYSIKSGGDFKLQSLANFSLNTTGPLIFSSSEFISEKAGAFCSRDAPTILDNCGASPPAPPVEDFEVDIIDQSIKQLINDSIIATIAANVRDSLTYMTKGTPTALKSIKAKLLRLYATKLTFEELDKPIYKTVVADKATEAGLDPTITVEKFTETVQQMKQDSTSQIQQNEDKMDQAIDMQIGQCQGLTPDDAQEVKDDAQAVGDKDKAAVKTQTALDQVAQMGSDYISDPIKNTLNSSLGLVNSFLGTDGRSGLTGLVNNTLTQFNSVIGSVTDSIDKSGVVNSLTSAIGQATSGAFELCNQSLKGAGNLVNSGLSSLGNKDVTGLLDIKAQADNILQLSMGNDPNKKSLMQSSLSVLDGKVNTLQTNTNTQFPTTQKYFDDISGAVNNFDNSDQSMNLINQTVGLLKQDTEDSMHIKKTFNSVADLTTTNNMGPSPLPTFGNKKDAMGYINDIMTNQVNNNTVMNNASKTLLNGDLGKVGNMLLSDPNTSLLKLNTLNSQNIATNNLNGLVSQQQGILGNFTNALDLSKMASSGTDSVKQTTTAINSGQMLATALQTLGCTGNIFDDYDNMGPQLQTDTENILSQMFENAGLYVPYAPTILDIIMDDPDKAAEFLAEIQNKYEINDMMMKNATNADLMLKNQLGIDIFITQFIARLTNINPLADPTEGNSQANSSAAPNCIQCMVGNIVGSNTGQVVNNIPQNTIDNKFNETYPNGGGQDYKNNLVNENQAQYNNAGQLMPPPPKTLDFNGPLALSDGSVAFYDSKGNYQGSQPPKMSNDTKTLSVLNNTQNTTNPQDMADSGRVSPEPETPLPKDFQVQPDGTINGSYTYEDGHTEPYTYKNMIQAQSGARKSEYNKSYAQL